MLQLKIISHRNNPPVSGWAGIGLAVLCFVLAMNSHTASSQEIWLKIFALMFLVIGCWILIWSPKRITIIDSDKKRVISEDSTRFNTKTRYIPFSAIDEVIVREWDDTDTDSGFKRLLLFYYVVIRLHNNEEIEVTDRRISDREIAYKVKTDISNAIGLK